MRPVAPARASRAGLAAHLASAVHLTPAGHSAPAALDLRAAVLWVAVLRVVLPEAEWAAAVHGDSFAAGRKDWIPLLITQRSIDRSMLPDTLWLSDWSGPGEPFQSSAAIRASTATVFMLRAVPVLAAAMTSFDLAMPSP
jgi:hypothetical protein